MDVKMLNSALGNADLILVDQILKNRFHKQMRILDAGCGEGRNMVYFIKNDFRIYGIDANADAVKLAKLYCRSLSNTFEVENIQNFTIEQNPFPDHFFDAIICLNVLHSAKNQNDFFLWFEQLIRMLHSGGFLLLSLQSQIGVSQNHQQDDPDDRNNMRNENFYLLTENVLQEILKLDYLKTIENTKTILIDNKKSHTYLFLERSD
jgi:2-polyprenyl-3-methyl-5-hydroxy-6-metoxy-1,4-benzoquinol methylase